MIDLYHPRTKWIFLTIAMLCYLLSGPVLRIGISGWFIPIGILFFTRSSRPVKGYLWAVLFMMMVSVAQGIFTSPLPFYAIIITAPIAAIPEMLPYLIDRIVYKKLNPLLASLFFPAVMVSLEYLLSLYFSTIGLLASTQTQFIEFIQLASITGVFGISFMMYWLASVLVPLLMKQENPKVALKPFIIVITLVMLYGVIRTRTINEVKETTKVSGIVLEEYPIWEALYEDEFGEKINIDINKVSSPEMGKVLNALQEFLKDPDIERYGKSHLAMQSFGDHLILLTEQEAKNGSEIIVWSETNLPIFLKDESAYLNRIKQLALDNKVNISISMAVLLPYKEGGPAYENKAVLITKDGNIADSYKKAKPVPFMDASLPGDGVIGIVNTESGKLAQVICYDADFPGLMSQSADADILILPANDWLGISPYHGDNAAYRAIENGVSVIRPTGSGQSVIIDAYGYVLSRTDAYTHEVRIVNAYVPKKGVTTVYSFIGNAIVWLSMISVIIFIGIGLLGKSEV